MRKRLLSLALSMAMIVTLITPIGTIAASAGGVMPKLMITEIVPNPSGTDYYEYVEIYNPSTQSVNLYDYSLAYSSSTANPPNKMTALKAGDIGINSAAGISNPDTMILAPGECAVAWSYVKEAAATIPPKTWTDFKAFWGLSDTVKLVAFDARSTDTLRFNMPNAETSPRAVHIVSNAYVLSPATPDELVCSAKWNALDYSPGTTTGVGSNQPLFFQMDTGAADIRLLLPPTAGTITATATPGVVNADQIPSVADSAAPAIAHTPLTTIGAMDTAVSATITDDAAVKSAKVYYRLNTQQPYTAASMTKLSGTDTYTYTIPRGTLLGSADLYYYIEAKDFYHDTTAPADSVIPYHTQIVDMSNAKLSLLKAGDTAVAIGDAAHTDASGNESYSLRVESIPVVTATAESSYATVAVTQASAENAYTATVTVTSGDGTKTKIYKIVFDVYGQTSTNLTELWVGNMRIGIGHPDYIDASGNENYTVKALALQTVAGTAESSLAAVTVTQASAENGNAATVTVISGNGSSTKTYTVTFNIEARKNADILLTEVVPNASAVVGTGNADESEFVEVYNDASYPINLYEYAIGYKTSATGTYRAVVPKPGNPGIGANGLINPGDPNEPLNPLNKADAVLKPGETAVIWVYYSNAVTAKATRQHFITRLNPSLSPSKIFIIDGRNDGTLTFNLANTGNRWVAFLTPVRGTGTYNQEISVLGYNIGGDTDGAEGKATIYQADPDGGKNMLYIGTGNVPTPGTVDAALQLIDFSDVTPPAIAHTQTVTALTGPQNVTVSAVITDTNLKYNKVKLFYKTEDIFEFTPLSVIKSDDTYTATIPASVMSNTASVKYYFSATDGPNTASSPVCTIALPSPSDATLSSLCYKGVQLPGFQPAKTWYELPLTGSSPLPGDFTVQTTSLTASAQVAAFNAATGNVTITVTSANTFVTKVYTVHFYTGSSSNTKLASLTAGGVPVRAFDSGITAFRVQYSGAIPQVAAAPDNADAVVEITQATVANPTAAAKVTAPDGTALTYTVNFVPTAAMPNYPELVVTEIMPNPLDDITGNKQPYEYMEIYNTSDHAINIADYSFVYYSTPDDPLTTMKYTDLTNDLLLQPKDTLVIWIRYVDSVGKTFADFNRHYNTHLDAQHLIDIPGAEAPNFNLANSGMKRISICFDSYLSDLTYQTGAQIETNPKFMSTFVYGENTEFSDVARGLSINFKPVDGSKQVEKYEWCVDPTTGYQKPEQMVTDYGDPAAPLLSDTTAVTPPLDLGSSNTLTVSANAWDETGLRYVRLYYKTSGMAIEQAVELTPTAGNNYSFTIPRSELLGQTYVDYKIVCADGRSAVSAPVAGYRRVAILDSFGPTVLSVKPQDLYYFIGEAQPTITAAYFDMSGVDISSVALTLNGTNVTADAAITATSISYTPAAALANGTYTLILTLADTAGNSTTKTWSFTVGDEIYNYYAGMLHSHTAESDGAGTVTEAYNYAKNTSHLDFYGLTDHSHYLTQEKFDNQKSIAATYDEPGKFVAIPGFEMTWNANVGWWGHMNAFNTGWIETLLTVNQNLTYFYNRLITTEGSLGQFNHPSDSWGDFGQYDYWSPEADKAIDLIEIRNATHDQDYIRALDAGWHLGPVNNDDTHTKGWGSSGAAGIVLAPSLTLDNILEAIHANRTYSTQDRTLRIEYTGNDKVMGTRLSGIDNLTLHVKINYAAANIGKVEIVTDTGFVYATRTVTAKTLDWTLTDVPVTNSYYYVRVNTTNSKFAVTAPIWVENVNALKVEKTVIGNRTGDAAVPYEVSLKIINTADTALTNLSAQVYRNNNAISGTPVAFPDIAAGASAIVSIPVAYDTGSRDIVIALSGIAGTEKAGELINLFLPELVVTELVTRTSVSGLSDPYQYIEIYNASGRTLDLRDYKFIWWPKCDTTETWDITQSLTLAPGDTAVVWVKYVSDAAAMSATLSDFNAKYGTNLTSSDIITLVIPSTLNSATGHKLYLDTDAGVIQQMVTYNIYFDVGKENIADKSILYAIDTAHGTYIQKKLGAGFQPTPGSVETCQVPYTGTAEAAIADRCGQLPLVISGAVQKTYGDAPFTVTASGGSGSGSITYSSSNEAVAMVNALTGLVTIKGAGSAVITAVKAGDDTFAPKSASLTLTVAKLAITVTADTITKGYKEADPALTYKISPSITGLAPLVGSLTREEGEKKGNYDILQGSLTNSNNPNYLITFVGATFEIRNANGNGNENGHDKDK